MEIAFYHIELAMNSLRIILIFLSILVCIEVVIKSSGRFKKSFTFFFIALISSIVYTIGRFIDIEARFTSGKFIGLTFNLLTTAFILIGLTIVNKLLNEISKEGETLGKTEEKREISFLISAAKRFKRWALSQKNPKISGSKEMFIIWLSKGGYGKNEKEICKTLGITKEDFTNIFEKYEKI